MMPIRLSIVIAADSSIEVYSNPSRWTFILAKEAEISAFDGGVNTACLFRRIKFSLTDLLPMIGGTTVTTFATVTSFATVAKVATCTEVVTSGIVFGLNKL